MENKRGKTSQYYITLSYHTQQLCCLDQVRSYYKKLTILGTVSLVIVLICLVCVVMVSLSLVNDLKYLKCTHSKSYNGVRACFPCIVSDLDFSHYEKKSQITISKVQITLNMQQSGKGGTIREDKKEARVSTRLCQHSSRTIHQVHSGEISPFTPYIKMHQVSRLYLTFYLV